MTHKLEKANFESKHKSEIGSKKMFEVLGELAVDVSLTRGDEEVGSTLVRHVI